MRLRTITGTRWPAKCADGCGQTIPANPEIKVVVDFEARPRKTWIPEHSPDAGTWGARKEPEDGRASQTRYDAVQATYRSRSSTSPKASPPVPDIPTAPKTPEPARAAPPAARTVPPTRASPEPHVSVDVQEAHEETGPGLPSGKAWACGQLSLRESSAGFCRVTFASPAMDGESEEDLRSRVNRALLADLEAQVVALRALRARLGYPAGVTRARPPEEMEP